MRVNVDTRDWQRYQRHLEKYAKQALPFAVSNAVNTMAFEARKEWLHQMDRAFILRNQYTTRSPRVVKSRAKRTLDAIQAVLGSPLEYLAEQESGHTEQKKGKHGVPIPTVAAAGGARGSAYRARSVRRKNYLSALSVAHPQGRSRQQRNAIAIRTASKTGGVAYLDLGRRRGLFQVDGSKGGLRIRMLYDLSRTSVTSRPRPTMQRTLDAIAGRTISIQAKAFRDELRRQKVLFY